MNYIYIIFFHISLFIVPLKANYTVVLTVIDSGNGFNDIRFKGAFSNRDVVQGYDDGLNGDTIAGDVFGRLCLKAYRDQLLMSGVQLTQIMEMVPPAMHAMAAMVGVRGY